MPIIHLIRHGQASFGSAEYDVLSELGVRQSALLDAALVARGVRADRVAVGTLARQAGTARACPVSAPGEPIVDARWNEYVMADVVEHHGPAYDPDVPRTDMGAPFGMDAREFQLLVDESLSGWEAAGETSTCAETFPAFQARALGALEDLAAGLGSGQHGMAFSSGGTIAVICAALLGVAPSTYVTLNRVMVNTSATKIMVGRGGMRLVTFNDHAHLEHDPAVMTFR